MMPPELTDDEQWLVGQVAAGQWANGGRRNPGGKVSVRVEVLRQLALGASRPFGVRASDLRVTGELDLVYAEIHGPLAFLDSEFDSDLNCSKMVCVDLDLSGSTFPSLICDGANFTHGLTLAGTVTKVVSIRECRINQVLNLNGAKIDAGSEVALIAEGATIADDLQCRGGFVANGQVRLIGATIGGQLPYLARRKEGRSRRASAARTTTRASRRSPIPPTCSSR
jgi:hypothetical protein